MKHATDKFNHLIILFIYVYVHVYAEYINIYVLMFVLWVIKNRLLTLVRTKD